MWTYYRVYAIILIIVTHAHNTEVPMNATYFREYGIHPVKQPDGDGDFIASFPTWEETAHTLKSDMPDRGNIVTPEYITAPADFDASMRDADAIGEHVREAISLTKGSDALLHLGTPTPTVNDTGSPRWFNSVLSIRNGTVESVAHKTMLVPGEEKLGIESPDRARRLVRTGNAVLICAELFLYALNPRNKFSDSNVRQVLAPTMWAHPAIPGANLKGIQKAGGEDNYYRQQLEQAVGSYLLRDMPSVQRVIVSDRGKSDLAPYNAVFDRVK